MSGSALTGALGPQEAAQQQQQPLPKYSRYQSVRERTKPKASSATRTAKSDGNLPRPHDEGAYTFEPPTIPASATGNSSIAKSMSRYRKRTNTVSGDHGDVTPKFSTAPLPASRIFSRFTRPKAEPPQKENAVSAHSHPSAAATELRHAVRADNIPDYETMDHHARPSTAGSERSQRWRMPGRRIKANDDAVMRAEEIARLEAEADRDISDEQWKELERLQTSAINIPVPSTPRSHKPKTPIVERFAMLLPGRKNREGQSPAPSPRSPMMSPTSSVAGSLYDSNASRTNLSELGRSPLGSASRTNINELARSPLGIEQGEEDYIMPQMDAPYPINTGERVSPNHVNPRASGR
jgi:hypothetical protein